MKKSTYTRTALASLLTLCSFSSFAADLSDESVKKQESITTSGKTEVMKTSNKKLREKMDRICNADPRKKAEELKKKEELAEKRKEMEKLANEKRAKALDVKNSNLENSKAKKVKTETKENIKTVSKKEKGKASPVVSVGGVNIIDTNQGKNGLRITFGGVVDAQGYGKAGPSEEGYKRYNIKVGKSLDYYSASREQIKGANPVFPGGIGNIGDYSEDMGMIADAILHLRAENKNEDLGLLYGADVQFHVPVTEGKGASQGVYAARGRGAHVFLNSKYGDLKLGYQFGPEALMRLDATRIATVDGAADSDWFRKVNLEGSAATFPFYVTPRLYTESFSSESEKLSFRMAGKYNKGVLTTLPFRITYYSPSYMGARFGVSYSPRYESSLFSVSEGSSAIDFDSGIENVANKFIKAGDYSYKQDKLDTLKADISVATNTSIAGFNGATAAEKEAAITAVAKALFSNIIQPDAAAVGKAIGSDAVIKGMESSFTITRDDINTLAATAKKYPNASAFSDDLKKKIGSAYTNVDDTGQADLAAAKKTVNEVIETAVKELIQDSELNKGRVDDIKRKAIEKQVKEVYGNAILLDGIKDGSHGSSAIRHVGPDYEHIISAGASYEYDFDKYNVKVKAAAVGEYGKAKEPSKEKHLYKEFVGYNDLMGVNFGISADYKINEDQGVKLAASFAYLGKSGQPKDIKKLGSSGYVIIPNDDVNDGKRVKGLEDQFVGDDKNTMYWTAGAGYQYESFYTSLTYFGSKMSDGDKLHDVALGVEYDLSAACSKSKFVPYAALHYFTTEEKQADSSKITKVGSADIAPSNKGVLFLTGVKFYF